MDKAAIRFGTDGWRGVMSRDFTFDNVRRVARALGLYLQEKGTARKGVAVGFDRRLLSDQYALEAMGVLCAQGIPVRLAEEYLPTPLLSWAVRRYGLAAGVMVTASHNPPEYNGIKIKEPYGGPSTSETNAGIEALLDGAVGQGGSIRVLSLREASASGLLSGLDPRDEYFEQLAGLVDFKRKGSGRPVFLDAMHGCGAGWTDYGLKLVGLKPAVLRGEYNPGFGGQGPEPVEKKLSGLMDLVADRGGVGLANDGDADRIAAVDERGAFFSPQRILAVIMKYLGEEKGLTGAVAKTVSATSMLDLLAEKYSLPVFETPIGFRHTGKLMNEQAVLIGGEESGAVGIGAHMPERDGVAAALLLAEISDVKGGLREYLQTVFDEIGYFTYHREDLKLSGDEAASARSRVSSFEPPERLCGQGIRKVMTLDGLKILRNDYSWLLMRPSGTEPLFRLYAEARSKEEAMELLKEGRRIAGIG